jgi:hypothetical protein
MVSVQLRNTGDGLWSQMTLPMSVQVAQTLAGAVKTLNLADQVRIQPAEGPPPPRPNGVDVRV